MGLLLLASPAAAQVTEEQAVEAALARPQWQARLARAGEAARAEGLRQTLWANPELGFERAELLGDEVEQRLVITQEIDISGRRSLLSEAAQRRADSAEQAVRFDQRTLRFEVRRRFAQVLHHQARHAALEAWVARLEQAQAVVARREAAGDVSMLERRRAARELARAQSDRVVEEVEREAAWHMLAALTGQTGEAWPRVVESDAALKLGDRPDIEALTRLAEAARLEEAAAERAWVPGLALSGGWQHRDETQGYVVGVALTLPVFDRGQAEGAAARAVEADAEQRRAIAFEVAQGAQAGLVARWQALGAEARRFADENVKDSEEMARMAEAAYAGGELTLIELLDAQRGALEDALQAIELARMARDTRIEAEEGR